MAKKWTQAQLARIYRDHPELKKVPILPIDEIVVEFLKLHDVAARPPKKYSARDGAIAGAIGGLAGPDVAGDAFIMQGQTRQTAAQEWTSWKQWALSHKDFPDFKEKLVGEAVSKNEEIDRKLNDPKFVEKWEIHFKKIETQARASKQKANKSLAFAMLAVAAISVVIGAVYNSPQSINARQEKIRKEYMAKVEIERQQRLIKIEEEKISVCNFLNARFEKRRPTENFVEDCKPLALQIKKECDVLAKSNHYENVFSKNRRWDKCARKQLSGLLKK